MPFDFSEYDPTWNAWTWSRRYAHAKRQSFAIGGVVLGVIGAVIGVYLNSRFPSSSGDRGVLYAVAGVVVAALVITLWSICWSLCRAPSQQRNKLRTSVLETESRLDIQSQVPVTDTHANVLRSKLNRILSDIADDSTATYGDLSDSTAWYDSIRTHFPELAGTLTEWDETLATATELNRTFFREFGADLAALPIAKPNPRLLPWFAAQLRGLAQAGTLDEPFEFEWECVTATKPGPDAGPAWLLCWGPGEGIGYVDEYDAHRVELATEILFHAWQTNKTFRDLLAAEERRDTEGDSATTALRLVLQKDRLYGQCVFCETQVGVEDGRVGVTS